MFLDADEYMDENCEALIKFFNDPALSSKYFSATYIQRNYRRSDKEQYSDFPALRIVRRTDKTRFEGNIHEKLMWYSPLYDTNVPFHHFGYITDEDNNCVEKKIKRNRPLLLKKYEQNPSDIQCVCEILDVSTEKEDELKWYGVLSGLITLPENKKLRNLGYAKLLKTCLSYKMYDELSGIVQRFFSHEGNEKSVTSLYVYIAAGLACKNTGRDEQALEYFEKYLSAYGKYKKNLLDTADLLFASVYGCSDTEHKTAVFDYTELCVSLKKYDKALEALAALDISDSDPESFRSAYIDTYIKIAESMADFSVMRPLLEKAAKQDGDTCKRLTDSVSLTFNSRPSVRGSILSQVEAFRPLDELYKPLKTIAKHKNGEDVTALLSELSDESRLIDARFPELTYISVKTGFDLTGSVDKAKLSDVPSICSFLLSQHDGFAAELIGYFDTMPPYTNIRTMLFYANALSAAAVSESASRLPADGKRVIYDNFITVLSDYVLNVYNPQLFTPEDIVVLPELHRFGYYMATAMSARNDGKQLEYVRALRTALKSCPAMKTVIEFYISELSL